MSDVMNMKGKYEPIFVGPVCIGVGKSDREGGITVSRILCNTLMEGDKNGRESLHKAKFICAALNNRLKQP